MEMYDLGNREDGKHQYAKQHRPFHGWCAIELALAVHALRM
jgi:predicted lipoprotein with Yx(FWY)xxD motif